MIKHNPSLQGAYTSTEEKILQRRGKKGRGRGEKKNPSGKQKFVNSSELWKEGRPERKDMIAILFF